MPNYPLQSIASAPEKSKPALKQFQEAFGIHADVKSRTRFYARHDEAKARCRCSR